MGKKPLTKNQVQKIRELVKNKPLQELLLNLSVDLMLRSSDLLALRVSDVINKNGSIKSEVKVRQKKTGRLTLPLPLSITSLRAITKHLSGKPLDDYIFKGQMYYCTKKPITSQQYARIVKGWVGNIGIDDVSQYSTHSMRKTKASVIYMETKDVEACRRLLGQSSVIATSAYLGVTDNSALKLAKLTMV